MHKRSLRQYLQIMMKIVPVRNTIWRYWSNGQDSYKTKPGQTF